METARPGLTGVCSNLPWVATAEVVRTPVSIIYRGGTWDERATGWRRSYA